MLRSSFNSTETFTLSKIQQGLLLHSQLSEKNQFYISQIRIEIEDTVDCELLQKCCQLAVDKHAILRASISTKDLQQATLLIHDDIKVRIKLVDISHYKDAKRNQLLESILDEDFLKKLHITKAPLMRWTLIKLAHSKHILLWTHHHVLLSGNEIAKILKEIFEYYDGVGIVKKTSDNSHNYSQYLNILNEYNQKQTSKYWQQLLKDYEPKELLLTKKNKTTDLYTHSIVADKFSSKELQQLQQNAKKNHISDYTILASAWAIVLSLFSNKSDIVFGSVRSFPEKSLRNVAGLFINTLPIRVEFNNKTRIEQLYKNVRKQQIKLRELVHTPLGEINKLMQLEPGQSLFETYIDYKPLSINQLLKQLKGSWSKRHWDYRLDTHYKLYLEIYGEKNYLVFRIHYDENTYSLDSIKPLMQYFKAVLNQLLSGVQTYVAEVDGLSEQERKQRKQFCTGQVRKYSTSESAIKKFETRALTQGKKLAVIDNDVILTYSMLNQLANQLAHKIANRTRAQGRYIGICLPKSYRYVVAILAIQKTGNAYVPLDPTYPLQRLKHIINDCKMPAVIVEDKKLSPNKRIVYRSDKDLALQPTSNLKRNIKLSAPAYAIYTSGTTGLPKGVAIRHKSLVNLILWHQRTYSINSAKNIALISPFTFDAATWMLWSALANGAQLHLTTNSITQDPIELQKWLVTSNIDQAFIPAAMVSLLLALKWPRVHRFKQLLTGGEKINLNTLPPKGMAVINHYGPTEYTVITTANLKYKNINEINYIGEPIDNTTIHIRDHLGRASPYNIPGELCISGDGIAEGYIGSSKLTKQVFVNEDNAFRMYKTGDMVRLLPSGQVEFIGRSDQQVKVRGYRIELGEIDNIISKYAGVQACFTTVITNTTGQKQIVLYYTRGKHKTSLAQLEAYAKKNLPSFMLPNAYVLVKQFELTRHGKIDKSKLPTVYKNNVTKHNRATREIQNNSKLAVIYQIISDILSIKINRMDLNASLFDYGGDSITVMQLVQRLHSSGYTITADQIFKHPVISDIASQAFTNRKKTLKFSTKQKLQRSFQVTPIQQWYLEQANIKQDKFNQSFTFSIQNKLDCNRLELAFKKLIEKHDALRLKFKKQKNKWIASCHTGKNNFKLQHNLKSINNVYFNLTKGLLIYAAADAYTNPTKLFISIHHLAVDVVSWRILIQDLEDLYARSTSRKSVKNHKFINAFQQWAQALKLQRSTLYKNMYAEYWQDILKKHGDIYENYSPKYNSNHEHNNWGNISRLAITIPAQVTNSLLGKANVAYNTRVIDIIITALFDSFSDKRTPEKLLALLIESHGRSDLADLQASQIVGWFTTLAPIVIRTASNNISEKIRQVKELLNGFQDKALSYSLLSTSGDNKFINPIPKSELIGFNYLGVVNSSSDNKMLTAKQPAVSLDVDPNKIRPLLIELLAYIHNSKLYLEVAYNKEATPTKAIQAKLDRFSKAITNLVSHCCEQSSRQYSVSDFPLLKSSQKNLDQFIQENINPFLKASSSIRANPRISDIYPLSPLQEGIHFHSLKSMDSDFYHVQTILEIKDNLETDLFKQAVLKVIAHFDIFRTGFITSHNLNSVQFVVSELNIPWQYYDWSHESTTRKQDKFRELIMIDRERLFNLSNPPLIRCYLVKQSKNHYRFILAYHHILMGGWSMSMVVTAIFNYYHALKNNQYYSVLLTAVYRPYVEWTLKSDHKKAQQYWTKLLGSYITSTKLTNENYLADLKGEYYKRQQYAKAFDRKILNKLRQVAATHKLTLNSILLGTWSYIISRYADSKDIVIGTTLASRPAQIENVDSIVGLLNSTIPVRAVYHSSELFINYLKRIQSQLLESQKYQYLSLVDIHCCTGLMNNESLFDYLYVFENYPLDKTKLKEFKVDSLRVIEKPHYKITLTIIATEHISFNINYDQSVLSNADVEQLMSSYLEVLSSIPNCYGEEMQRIEVISKTEQHKLLRLWQGKHLAFDESLTLRDYYQMQFKRVPKKTAVIFNDVAISYKQLDIQSTKFANQFLTFNIKPGDVIAIILNRDLNLIYSLVAIVKLGCTSLPIDPNYPQQRINDILMDAKPSLIVSKKIFSKKIKTKNKKLFYIDLFQSAIAAQSNKLPSLKLSNKTPAYILYTSGSTGKPKGVVISYAALLNFLHSAKKLTDVNQHHHFLISTTNTFDIFNYEFHTPFILGATATLIEHKDQISGANLIQIIEKNKIDVIQATPVTWNLLFNAGFIPKVNQKFICGGDVMTKQLARNMQVNGAVVYNIYGPSETTIWSSCHEIKEINDKIASIPIGIPLNNTYIYLFNSDMQLVPKSVVGTLFIGGDGLGLGYLNNDKLTQQKFIHDPYKPGKLIYDTGDLVKLLRSGDLLFVGRSDNQVKIHGYRIELSEIESRLNNIKQIRQSAVIIKKINERDSQLIAFVTKNSNYTKLTINDLKKHLAEYLPTFMIPNHFEYLEKMPLSPSRKIDKKSLEKVKLHLPHLISSNRHAKKYNKLIQIWSTILSLEPNSVHIDDNFFTVGGNSIQAVSLITKINHALNTEFGVNDLFVYPTIRALYNQLRTAKCKIDYSNHLDTTSIISPIVCLQKNGNGYPLFLLHPIGGTLYIYQPLIRELGEARPIYGIHDPSINAGDLMFTSFREMASYYVSLIKQKQASGPYHLLGASFGANMVEEITKQLIQHGDHVAFTGLIDGWAHYPAKALKNKEWFYTNLSRQHKMVAQMVGNANQDLPKSLLAINWHRQQLLAKHELSYSESKITLFKAKELTPVLSAIDSEFNYWDMYYPGGLNLHLVPGDHETMLMPPNVKYLAQQILLYLTDNQS